ncbi:transposase [Candidatus Enterovibrio escicola]|uniref:transposase n=1 Tax=Candidatus Enterovibrio escicola TaxID=1927127 RepID=UPI0021E03878|nr:transposase [Candidatus Enterovibrio escacola]
MGKVKHKINNWKQYNQTLVNRGSVTFGIDDDAIEAWHCPKHHGRGFIFVAIAIETVLMVKGICEFTLRYYNIQVAEALTNMTAINKVIRLGVPIRQQTN